MTLAGPVEARRPAAGSEPDLAILVAAGYRALTERLARLRKDPTLATRFGAEGRQRAVEQFDWARVGESMTRTWMSLLRTDGVRPVAGSVVGS